MNRPRPSPLSIRLSDGERAQLLEKAAGRPLGTFIREAALGITTSCRGQRAPVKDGAALGQVLGLLGRSHLASNLNQIAKAINLGTLPVTPELEADLRTACADIRFMRSALLKALGVSAQDFSGSLTSQFAQAAGDGQ